MGAVYLDGGFGAAFRFLDHHFPYMVTAADQAVEMRDFKSRFQETVQLSQKTPPVYQVVDTSGPDHEKTFTVQVKACGVISTGSGKSKKLAEQEAARKALLLLSAEAPSQVK